MGRLQDKVAIITGGASGIGKAVATLFVKEGARVVIADIDARRGKKAATALGENALFFEQNVADVDSWPGVFAAAKEQWGRVDILINNAAVGILKDIEEVSLDEWHFVHSVTLDGVFLGCKQAIQEMKDSGGGSIVNLSSIAGLRGVPEMVSYATSKGAVRMLSKTVALHCARKNYNIRCNSVHPSFIDTPMVEKMIMMSPEPEKTEAFVNSVSPLRRMGKPEEVAHMVLYLASDESSFVNGAEFVIDGGLMAK